MRGIVSTLLLVLSGVLSPVKSQGTGRVCDRIPANFLRPNGVCTCTATTGGTGLVMECTDSISGIGTIGVTIQLEPCGNPAFAEISYQFNGNSESARIEAGGAPLSIPIPGASLSIPFVGSAGAYLVVSVAGNAADLSVDAHISVCMDGRCDGNMSGFAGSAAGRAGLPKRVLDFDDLEFGDCPASLGSPIGIATAVVVVMLVVACFIKKMMKNRATNNRPTTQPPGVVMTSVATTSIVQPNQAVPVATPVPTTAVPTAMPADVAAKKAAAEAKAAEKEAKKAAEKEAKKAAKAAKAVEAHAAQLAAAEAKAAQAAQAAAQGTATRAAAEANEIKILFDGVSALGLGLIQLGTSVGISSVAPTSAAAAVPLFSMLTAINGKSCAGKSKDEVLAAIGMAKAAGPFTLAFAPPEEDMV